MQVGEYYREVDSRFIRYVRVDGIHWGKNRVYIRTVGSGRRTGTNMDRFDGRKGGYRLVSEKEVMDYLIEISR